MSPGTGEPRVSRFGITEIDDLPDDLAARVGAITALFAMSNRLAHLTALRPDAEFFGMGREPRG